MKMMEKTFFYFVTASGKTYRHDSEYSLKNLIETYLSNYIGAFLLTYTYVI